VNIVCHYAIPRPPLPELDAAVQDGLTLIDSFSGEINFLYPGSKPRGMIPRCCCGFHQLPYLWELDGRVDIHHVFSNGIYPYPILQFFNKPIVYTSVIDVEDKLSFFSRFLLKNVDLFVVATERDRKKMGQFGLDCGCVLPGIDIKKFSTTPLLNRKEFVLLAGSAPWNEAQFESKGVNALLETAAALPWLKLIFFWRGKLLEEMREKVEQYGVSARVTIITGQADVNKVLGTVHAAVVLAAKSKIVKGYPHSLLEALAAGKPVVVSQTLAIADYVKTTGCGVCVDTITSEELGVKLSALRKEYADVHRAVSALDLSIFTKTSMVYSYEKIYRNLLASETYE